MEPRPRRNPPCLVTRPSSGCPTRAPGCSKRSGHALPRPTSPGGAHRRARRDHADQRHGLGPPSDRRHRPGHQRRESDGGGGSGRRPRPHAPAHGDHRREGRLHRHRFADRRRPQRARGRDQLFLSGHRWAYETGQRTRLVTVSSDVLEVSVATTAGLVACKSHAIGYPTTRRRATKHAADLLDLLRLVELYNPRGVLSDQLREGPPNWHESSPTSPRARSSATWRERAPYRWPASPPPRSTPMTSTTSSGTSSASCDRERFECSQRQN